MCQLLKVVVPEEWPRDFVGVQGSRRGLPLIGESQISPVKTAPLVEALKACLSSLWGCGQPVTICLALKAMVANTPLRAKGCTPLCTPLQPQQPTDVSAGERWLQVWLSRCTSAPSGKASSSAAAASSSKKPAKKGAKSAKKQAKQQRRAAPVTEVDAMTANLIYMMQDNVIEGLCWVLDAARKNEVVAAAMLEDGNLLDWLEV
jgi:hypothetical protein